MGWFGKRDQARDRTPDPTGGAPPPPDAGAGATGDIQAVQVELVAWVCQSSVRGLRPEDVDPSASLYDAGYVDSMTAADLLAFVEKRFGVFVPDLALAGPLGRLEALASHIAAARPESGR